MKNIIEKKNDSGEVFCRIDKKAKNGEYFIIATDRRKQIVNSPIIIDGFDRLPSGFYAKDGFGLTIAGNLIVQEIHNRFNKKIDLTVTSKGKGKIDNRGKFTKVTLPITYLSKLGQSIRNIKRERNEEMRLIIQRFLGKTFSQFKDLKDLEMGYVPGKLAEVLGTANLLNKLSLEDKEALETLIPDYLSSIPGTLRAKKKLQVIYSTLDAGKKIYLEKVLAEFKSKLKHKVQSEQTWQDFLSNYILLLRHSYGEVLEKESVSLQGKFPDFMLVDPYGYLDIYEIKKPSTNLMKLDNSRNNYYWDTEISKAIAQVENYIHQTQRNGDALTVDIKRTKGLDVNIVRPRGYIIAGLRTQLTSEKMKDDFRIMCESLKNVDIILYDDLLTSLDAFITKTKLKD